VATPADRPIASTETDAIGVSFAAATLHTVPVRFLRVTFGSEPGGPDRPSATARTVTLGEARRLAGFPILTHPAAGSASLRRVQYVAPASGHGPPPPAPMVILSYQAGATAYTVAETRDAGPPGLNVDGRMLEALDPGAGSASESPAASLPVLARLHVETIAGSQLMVERSADGAHIELIGFRTPDGTLVLVRAMPGATPAAAFDFVTHLG